MSASNDNPAYLHGFSPVEQARLMKQARLLESGLIVGVLHDQAAVGAGKGETEQGAHRGPQQAGFETIAGEDMAEARRVFAEVKARTPASSPIFPRIKKLEKAYE